MERERETEEERRIWSKYDKFNYVTELGGKYIMFRYIILCSFLRLKYSIIK